MSSICAAEAAPLQSTFRQTRPASYARPVIRNASKEHASAADLLRIENNHFDTRMKPLDERGQRASAAAHVKNALTRPKRRLLQQRPPGRITAKQLHYRIVERQRPIMPSRGKISSRRFHHGFYSCALVIPLEPLSCALVLYPCPYPCPVPLSFLLSPCHSEEHSDEESAVLVWFLQEAEVSSYPCHSEEQSDEESAVFFGTPADFSLRSE